MKPVWTLALVATLVVAQSAQAKLYDVSYTGTIDSIFVPAGAQGLAVGDTTRISFRYDTDDLIDISNAPGLARYNAVSVPGLYLASLANSYNRLTINVGTAKLHAADDYDFGSDGGFGGFPNSPWAVLLNGALLGVEFEGYYDLVSDIGLTPIAHLTEPDVAVGDLLGYYYPDLSDFEIYEISYAGSFDLASARITAVPEPATWLLLVGGFGSVGGAMRRRKERTARRRRSLRDADTPTVAAHPLPSAAPFQAMRAVAATNTMKPIWLRMKGLAARVKNSPSGAYRAVTARL